MLWGTLKVLLTPDLGMDVAFDGFQLGFVKQRYNSMKFRVKGVRILGTNGLEEMTME